MKWKIYTYNVCNLKNYKVANKMKKFNPKRAISIILGICIGLLLSTFLALMFVFQFEGRLDKIPKKIRELVYGKENEQSIYGNDFQVVYTKIDLPLYNKTAGIFAVDKSHIVVYEQDSLDKLWKKYGLEFKIKDAKAFLDKGGGLKQIFNHSGDLFGLVTLVGKNHCYFASLINFSKSKEIFRAPCLPDADIIDLNGVGGGFAELGNNLLLAIGAPEHHSHTVANLAQESSSPYGKILIFSHEDLYNQPDSSTKFTIYSSGHRNPQGMVNIDGDIYSVEHGPKGGDEINYIEKNGNYGWPLYSLGSKYSDDPYLPIGDPKNFKMPLFAFTPSVATSDIRACPKILKKRYEPLQCLLVSALRGRSIFVVLIEQTTRRVIQLERFEIGMRVREFSRESDDDIYFTTDGLGIYNLSFTNVGQLPKH
jgi:hypothetical protein